MSNFQSVFGEVPVGRTVAAHWSNQGRETLDAAASVIDAHGANPWVFAADARHFWQFASTAEVAAMQAMTAAQFSAVCGEWDDADQDPASFGYSWPK